MKAGWVSSFCLLAAAVLRGAPAVEKITPHVSFVPGAVNGVLIERGADTIAIYGDPRPQPARVSTVFFTHHRRDVVWAGRTLVSRGARAIAPEAEKELFTGTADFWSRYRTARFHDYANQSSRILAEPLPLARTVRGGDRVDGIEAIDSPGYTRGAVSYLIEIDGKRIACTGDLIYGDGRILDLFSLQDAIPQVKEDGYHGWAARAGDVVSSLRRIAAWKPDVLLPARGPAIRNPAAAIEALIGRLQAVFASHFSIDALRWYRGDDRLRAMAARVLGERPVEWMEMAETVQEKLPEWIIPITNSRLIVSRSGAAFLVDCGNQRVVDTVAQLKREGRIQRLDAIYITHYHDDHTNLVQSMADRYHCPVYFTGEMQDILEHPESYRMPCLTPNAIHGGRPMESGARIRWNEFELSYSYFPGQTVYHGGLRAARDDGQSIFFVGDSFTPSGMDDYCLLNRNFFAPERGFLDCLRQIRGLTGDYLLINQHVAPAFRFSPAQLDRMIHTFTLRRDLMAALFPWDDPNFGVDEQWARFYPYTAEARVGQPVRLRVVLRNHSPKAQQFRVTPRAPAGWSAAPGALRVTVPARQEGAVEIQVTPGTAGLGIVTAGVAFGAWDLQDWTEAVITAK